MVWGVVVAVLGALLHDLLFEGAVAVVGHAVFWPVRRVRPGWNPSEGALFAAGLAGVGLVGAVVWSAVSYWG